VYRSLSTALRHLLAPDCAVCGIAAADPPGSPVCAPCRADFFPMATLRCRICANRLPTRARVACADTTTGLDVCGRCLTRPPHFAATIALADYAPPVDAMVAALKFHNRLDLGRAFGLLLAERARAWQGDAVLALPLAAPRLCERGYNQAEEIARVVAARLGRPLLRHALLRVRHCASQQGLRLAQRRSNVRGAFAAGPAAAGLHLLLVDDVLTSGSTLDQAAAALRRAGALSVTNAVVARTP
jgi:ComF family protein